MSDHFAMGHKVVSFMKCLHSHGGSFNPNESSLNFLRVGPVRVNREAFLWMSFFFFSSCEAEKFFGREIESTFPAPPNNRESETIFNEILLFVFVWYMVFYLQAGTGVLWALSEVTSENCEFSRNIIFPMIILRVKLKNGALFDIIFELLFLGWYSNEWPVTKTTCYCIRTWLMINEHRKSSA